MTGKIRWGIMSTGKIAHKFAQGLKELPDEAEILAVGSRAQQTADAFGDEFGIPRRYASYEALVADADVDVVYIGTPHSFHYDNAVLCLNAGKAVLCEKAFTITGREAEELIALARSKRLFLMEAMWVRFLPATIRVRELVSGGAIGEPRLIQASLGFWTEMTPETKLSRFLNPALGGGSMFDVGIYPMSYISMLFGQARRVTGVAHIGETGVDEQASVCYGYDDGRIASAVFGVRTRVPGGAFIAGSAGTLTMEPSFLNPKTLSNNWKVVAVQDMNADGKPDLVLQEFATKQMYVWYMNGINRTGGAFLNPKTIGGAWRAVGGNGAWVTVAAGA
ncbi:MAG TPA: Gfo/Idh/MocA family oxidoreductase, partial [Candidatus Latescibacteria bacterium]|nr:Gfo/Idh/MocA family oxidoreductase [Candidatus Latescibacterota bacterium]